jgi:rhodanese-related sulfurtransferase
MTPLPDFVARVQKIAKPDDVLLVACRSGDRGAMAVNQLAKAGFTNAYNVTDGIEGDTVSDPNSVFKGQRMVNGWKNSGLPWTYDVDPARMVLPAPR